MYLPLSLSACVTFIFMHIVMWSSLHLTYPEVPLSELLLGAACTFERAEPLDLVLGQLAS